MVRNLDGFDLGFLALLSLLLVVVLRMVRGLFDSKTGRPLSEQIVQDFALAAGVYVGARLALGLGGPVGAAIAGTLLLVGTAGGWIRRALEGGGGNMTCPDGSEPIRDPAGRPVLCVGGGVPQ